MKECRNGTGMPRTRKALALGHGKILKQCALDLPSQTKHEARSSNHPGPVTAVSQFWKQEEILPNKFKHRGSVVETWCMRMNGLRLVWSFKTTVWKAFSTITQVSIFPPARCSTGDLDGFRTNREGSAGVRLRSCRYAKKNVLRLKPRVSANAQDDGSTG